ncbi:MAG: MFS transporter [Chloroflexi bacterium]|nr:MFS transporter [Chloroflexota bacterium]
MEDNLIARHRVTITLFFAQSLFSAAMIAAFTITPILAARLSGQDSAAGLPSTLSLIGRAVAVYPFGWLMDRIGRRLGLSLGFGLGVVGMALSGWAILMGSFGWFLAGMLLFGMGHGVAGLSRYVAAEVHPAENRAKAIGLIVFAGTVGAVGGPMLVEPSRRWVSQLDYLADTGPYFMGAAFMTMATILIWALLRPDPQKLIVSETADGEVPQPSATPLWQLFANSQTLLALASMAIGQLVMVLIMVITPLHMNRQAYDAQDISFVIMAHTLGMFGLAWLTGGLVDKYGRLPLMFLGALILIIAAVMTPFVVGIPMLALSLFLLGLGWNFTFVAGSSLLTDSIAAGDKGRVQGAAEVIVNLSSGTGSLGAGPMFAGGGMIAVSGAGLALVLMLLAGTAWFSWSQRAILGSV